MNFWETFQATATDVLNNFFLKHLIINMYKHQIAN
jgi:hypothetical protein